MTHLARLLPGGCIAYVGQGLQGGCPCLVMPTDSVGGDMAAGRFFRAVPIKSVWLNVDSERRPRFLPGPILKLLQPYSWLTIIRRKKAKKNGIRNGKNLILIEPNFCHTKASSVYFFAWRSTSLPNVCCHYVCLMFVPPYAWLFAICLAFCGHSESFFTITK